LGNSSPIAADAIDFFRTTTILTFTHGKRLFCRQNELLKGDPNHFRLLKEGWFMLVLTRGIGQEIVIDGVIRVNVVAVKGDKVRIGIEAPDHIRVDRQEVHERRFATVLESESLEVA
jgi:carbon storage regulator